MQGIFNLCVQHNSYKHTLYELQGFAHTCPTVSAVGTGFYTIHNVKRKKKIQLLRSSKNDKAVIGLHAGSLVKEYSPLR